jgi:WD40 repeat protein/serine/threonine protein kinase
MKDLQGQSIKGYELHETIGLGGFGAVYRAYQPNVGREVAIKVILPQYANHPDFIRRFEVEAQVIARLEHPHIIPLYDYWRDHEGAYLVMRYVRGGNLRSALKEGSFTLEETSTLLDSVAGALAVAHRHGVIHRDIKPDNILLDENGNAYLTDFGIAKDLDSNIHVTQADMVVGSPAYLSPEQVKTEAVTPQSDIYSLGIVLYEMLVGEHPFPDEKATALLIKHLNEPVPLLSTLDEGFPPELDEVIQRATAKNPEERYPDVPTLAAAFRHVVQGESSNSIVVDVRHRTRSANELLTNRTLLTSELNVDNPYKGLAAFEEVDSANFFGREKLTDHLITCLREQENRARFLALVGPSGSGKSSVIQAGLIPRMRSGTLPGSANWFMVEMVPGSHPLEELEAALLRIAVNPPNSLLQQLREDERGLVRATKRVLMDQKSELFLFIDQFEEVFTQAKDPAEVEHFLSSLVMAVTDPDCRLWVMLTLRADFYDQPLLHPKFGDLLRQHTEVVLPLSPEELENAIAGPAERVGVVLEQGLVPQIISDISQQPGALPLLQYALTELFERRSGRVLTLEAYHSIGGALGALANRAGEVYANLDAEHQEQVRQLFLRLITLGEAGVSDTRRRILQSEALAMASDPVVMRKIIEDFDRSRLLTFDHDPVTREPTIEIAHEALIREWGVLRQWLEDSREDLLLYRRLEVAANEWTAANHDPSYLLSGARLTQFQELQAQSNIAMRPEEVAYLEACLAAETAQKAAEIERQAREDALEERSRNRLRLLVMVMAGATVLAIGLAGFAFLQSKAAHDARVVAEESQIRAEESQLIAEASQAEAEARAHETRSLALTANVRNLLNEHNPSLALALAIEAAHAFEPVSATTQRVLAQSIYGPGARYRFMDHEGAVMDVATNGVLAASASLDGTVKVWDLTTGEEQESITFEGEDLYPSGVAMSRDGEYLLIGLSDGRVMLWDVAENALVRQLEGHSDSVFAVAFDTTERRILSSGLDRLINIWDAQTGQLLQSLESPGAVLTAMFSPDGNRVLTGTADLTIDQGHPVEERDRKVRIWNLRTGEISRELDPGSGFVRAATFSPDGIKVLAGTWNASEGGRLNLWNSLTGRMEQVFYGHSDIISDLQFSADGTQILSASWDRSVRLWDVSTGLEVQRFEGHQDRVLNAIFTPDEQYVLAGTGNAGGNRPQLNNVQQTDTSLWVWDLKNRMEVRAMTGHESWIWAIDISPDARFGVSGSGPLNANESDRDTSVRLWDMSTGEMVRQFDGHTDTVHGLAFGRDGQAVFSASWDGTVRRWDLVTGDGQVMITHENDEGAPVRSYSVTLNAAGNQALSTGGDSVYLWDSATGDVILSFEENDSGANVNYAAFSPDETLIATASADGMVRLWDAASGELLQTFAGHSSAVTGVAFSPDGAWVLSSSTDSTLRLWDVATGETIREFVGHNHQVFSPVFSADGRLVLSTSADLSIRLWDVHTGEEVRRMDGHTNWVLSARFSPNGEFILSGAEDNTLRQWQMSLTPEELIEWAQQNRYIPLLSCAERAQYQVLPLCEGE